MFGFILRGGKIDNGGVRFKEAKIIHHHPLIYFNSIQKIQHSNSLSPKKENEEKHTLSIN